ncbi:MAG TPA: hypothetical protein VFQ89_11370, partial [Candidatus Binatia bacterium]|nr:hypothetical protein [Candidatus Binatia bacterium]
QMALGEAKNKAKREFAETLEQIGMTADELRMYVDEHPEMRKAMYKVPHFKGTVGTAANFARHIAERAKAESWAPKLAVAVQ